MYKMNVLIPETSYSNFCIDLARYMKPKKVYSFVFNLGYIVYLGNSKKIYINKSICRYSFSNKDILIAKTSKNLFSELRTREGHNISNKEYEYIAKCISYARDFIINNSIEFVIMANGLRWQHAVTIQILKDLNIKYIVLEQGYFRPNTITMDFEGVNANSNLCNMKLNNFKFDYDKKEIRSYRLSNMQKYSAIFKFAIFILINKLGDTLNINTPLKNKVYSLKKYFKNFISKKNIQSSENKESLPEKFIYIPLQVDTDTQILLHSDFNNMQEFITFIENTFYSIGKTDIKLVFNIHPMKKGNVNYIFNNKSIVSNLPTSELIKKSFFIITINSTVGLEGLIKYKNVVVVGNAFYKIQNLCVCSNRKKLKDDMEFLINNNVKVNKTNIDNFLYFLKYNYQINGNFYNYDNHTLDECLLKIQNQLALKL